MAKGNAHMSTYNASVENFPVAAGAKPAAPLAVTESLPQLPEALDEAKVIRQILDAKHGLYSPPPGIKVEHDDIWAKELPTTTLPLEQEASDDDRQHVALADLEFYEQVANNPRLLDNLASGRTAFTDHWWVRDDEASTPVYTRMMRLSPNFALLLSFDLDDQRYATSTSAQLWMSKNRHLLHHKLSNALSHDNQAAA